MVQPTSKRLVTEAANAAVSTADRNRANHSGESPISTVTGLQAALDARPAIADLAAVAITGNRADLIGTQQFAIRVFNTTTNTWPARPDAVYVWNWGGDEAHPPTGSVTNNDMWDRPVV